jgi:hypothetical protein
MQWFFHNKMQWYWAAWIMIGFLVPELYAVFTKNYKNTLSDTTWTWFDVVPGQTFWQFSLLHFLLLGALTLLELHLGFAIVRQFR